MRSSEVGYLIILTALLSLLLPGLSRAENVHANLSGYNEVHFSAGPPAALRGAISTRAEGRFKAKINEGKEVIEYELDYKGLRGEVTQAHIHFGQRHSLGGIVVWLCQTAGTPAPAAVAALTPFCPAEGTVTGTIVSAQILSPNNQGFDGEFGDFDALVRAIRHDAAYVNVHSSLFGPGEIRGQINGSRRGRD